MPKWNGLSATLASTPCSSNPAEAHAQRLHLAPDELPGNESPLATLLASYDVAC